MAIIFDPNRAVTGDQPAADYISGIVVAQALPARLVAMPPPRRRHGRDPARPQHLVAERCQAHQDQGHIVRGTGVQDRLQVGGGLFPQGARGSIECR